MKKEKIISIVLKIMSVVIILIGASVFIEYRLWRESIADFSVYLKTFIPILVLGFSGTLYGIATLLNKDK